MKFSGLFAFQSSRVHHDLEPPWARRRRARGSAEDPRWAWARFPVGFVVGVRWAAGVFRAATVATPSPPPGRRLSQWQAFGY